MKTSIRKALSVFVCMSMIFSVCASFGNASGYKPVGWGSPTDYSENDAKLGKYAVKIVFYGYGDAFSNSSGKIWLEYYSENGAGKCSNPYQDYSLPSNVWESSSGNNTEMNVVLSGFPCHASCSFDTSITASKNTTKEGGAFMAMYVWNINSSSWEQIGGGSGQSVKASGSLFSSATKNGNFNLAVRVNEGYSDKMPSLTDGFSFNKSDLIIDNNNYLNASNTVSINAKDQYGVSIVKSPNSFNVNPSKSENVTISSVSDSEKRISCNYKTENQSVNVSAEYTLGKPTLADGNYFDVDTYCSEKTYSDSDSFNIYNNTSDLTVTPSFKYYQSNIATPSAPITKTVVGESVIKNSGVVEIPSEINPVPDYYDADYHYTDGTFGEVGTIGEDTVFTASGYTKGEHSLILKCTEPTATSAGILYYECECGYKCGVKYENGEYSPDKKSLPTPIPAPEINTYKSSEVNYALRGAALRKDAGVSDTQYMRFTASAKFPEGAEIVDFGFLLTRTKYVFGNEPVNNKAYNADDFVIGNDNYYDYPIYSEKGNYTLRDDGTYTSNLVVNIGKDSWKTHYAARSYVSYIYNGKVVTVYDSSYSSRTVKCIADRVNSDSSATSSDKSYVTDKILSNYSSSLKMLKQNGRDIVNSSGNVVQLTGVNLGGWLLQEAWMTPINKGDSDEWGQWDTDNLLENRFGSQGKEQLLDIYRSNWITQTDLDYLKNLGVNCVRVPFWYGDFINSDDSLDWKKDETGNIDFSYLDWIVNECAQRNIYVILDLHGAIGFQSTNHSCGKCNSMKLFESSESNKYIELNKAFWKTIANRYKDNPAVAGYDILNEAMNNDDGKTDEQRRDVITPVYDALYDAIREVDTNHLIIMEGIWNVGALPKVTQYSWNNVAYSCHNYNYKTSEIDDKISWYDSDTTRYSLIPSNSDYWVPMIVGEFQPGEILDYVCNKYNNAFDYTKKTADYGFSWLTWSYKGTGGLASSTWFMRSGSSVADATLESDSFETIAEKWGSSVRTENAFPENTVITKGTDGKSQGLSHYYIPLP